ALEIQLELDRLKRETTTEPVPIDAEAKAAHEFVASEEEAHDAGTSDQAAGDEPATATAASAEPSTVGDEAQKAIARAGSLRGAKVPPPAIVPLAPPAPAPISPPASAPAEHAAAVEARSESPHDALADIRDDVDEQVLPIFLEEAAELYPQAGEQVRGWRRSPRDAGCARQLQRTLHT